MCNKYAVKKEFVSKSFSSIIYFLIFSFQKINHHLYPTDSMILLYEYSHYNCNEMLTIVTSSIDFLYLLYLCIERN